MGGYTRLTVQGAARKAEVVLPDDEPVAELLPQLIDLLAENRAAGARPLSLITLLGQQIDPARSLGQQDVVQGSLLRLVRVDQAPPPPEVADITDVVAETFAGRADRWRPEWSRALAAGVAALAGGVAAITATRTLGTDRLVAAQLVLLVTVLAAAGARMGGPAAAGPGIVLGAAAAGGWAGLAPGLAPDIAQRVLVADVPGGALLLGWAGVCLVVAAVAGFGLRDVAAGAGALAGAGLAGSGFGLTLITGGIRAVAIVAVLGALVLGLLPGWAMTVSGLNGLDDRAVAGHRPDRPSAESAAGQTYRALTWSTVAVSGVAGVCGWVLVQEPDPWSRVLACLVALLVVLRARVLPLVPQRLALWAAAAVTPVTWALTRATNAPEMILASCAGVIVLAALVAGITVPGPTAARVRRAASVLELIVTVATVPVLLAQLGVFGDLLETF